VEAARGGSPATIREEESALVVTGAAGELRFDRRTGMLSAWRRAGRAAPLGAGPAARAYVRRERTHVPVPDAASLLSLSSRRDGHDIVVDARYKGILQRAAWRIGPSAGEGVTLECEYAYDGEVDLLGVGFDLQEASVAAKRWLGRGPYRVYRNRLEGGVFDVHRVAFNDPVPGQSFTYPEFKGYFGDWSWLQLEAADGTFTVENRSDVPFFALHGPRDGQPPMLAFPDAGLALLDIVPAQATKFDTPDQLGPQSRTPTAGGTRRIRVSLRFQPR
jgi:hypothetical protein